MIVLLLLPACRRDPPATNTIAPADPRPAPTVVSTADLQPAVTTSGSPPPAVAVAASENVTIAPGRIEVRPLIPRGSTVFRMTNETGAAHSIVLRGASGEAPVAVAARSAAILQVALVDPDYELICTTPGHRERARFETYRPVAPIP
jgi:hypothetical protein